VSWFIIPFVSILPDSKLAAKIYCPLVQGVRAAAATREALKRKRDEEEKLHPEPETAPLDLGAPILKALVTLSHEFVAPIDYAEPENLDVDIHGGSFSSDTTPETL
jgi:hypothetical protein